MDASLGISDTLALKFSGWKSLKILFLRYDYLFWIVFVSLLNLIMAWSDMPVQLI